MGDYTRKKGYQREISHWLGELSFDSKLGIVSEESNKLKNIDSRFFMDRVDSIFINRLVISLSPLYDIK